MDLEMIKWQVLRYRRPGLHLHLHHGERYFPWDDAVKEVRTVEQAMEAYEGLEEVAEALVQCMKDKEQSMKRLTMAGRKFALRTQYLEGKRCYFGTTRHVAILLPDFGVLVHLCNGFDWTERRGRVLLENCTASFKGNSYRIMGDDVVVVVSDPVAAIFEAVVSTWQSRVWMPGSVTRNCEAFAERFQHRLLHSSFSHGLLPRSSPFFAALMLDVAKVAAHPGDDGDGDPANRSDIMKEDVE